MSKPSEPSDMHGGAPPLTWSSERWCARKTSCAVPNYQTTSTELFKLVGKQFKRKHPGKHVELMGWAVVQAQAPCGKHEERTALRQ
jgi:hypothetical protein